jgi:hypothetical protein
VWKKPSASIAARVASGRLWYSRMTPGERTSTSPESAMRTSTPGIGLPTVSSFTSPEACMLTVTQVSVIP